MTTRRIFWIFTFTCIVAIGILFYYFFFTTPEKEPTLATPTNSLPSSETASHFAFITKYFTGNEPETTSTTEITPAGERQLLQVWNKPATGQTFISIPVLREVASTSTISTSTVAVKRTVRATSTMMMFVDRATGNVYGHNMETGTTYQITNTTIPGVYDAYIFNKGKQILLRHLDSNRKTIISILAGIPSIPEGGVPLPLIGQTFLPQNITSVAVSDSSDKLSYVVANGNGSAIYTISSSGQALTATSPLSEWILSYGGERLYATSKASAYEEGSIYLLPSFSRIVGGRTGLLSLPSSVGMTINSMWSSQGLYTFISSNKGEVRGVSFKTLPQKCDWLSGAFVICAIPDSVPQSEEGLPDDWYQGRVSFNDTAIYLVSAVDGGVSPLYTFENKDGLFDIVSISTTDNYDYLSFVRKQDRTLWLLTLAVGDPEE
jgi:hypothetical protein